MSEFRFLHAADLHLDSPMRGLEADPDAPAQLLRGASRAALRNLVNAAIEERVAFLVIAGDLYDGDWQDWRTGHFFTEQAAKLADAGIPVVLFMEDYDIDREGYHDSHDTLANIDAARTLNFRTHWFKCLPGLLNELTQINTMGVYPGFPFSK